MNTNCNFIEVNNENNIELKANKRGDVPYYTLTQVASLLNEDEHQIRYYTNIFNDILKIEILDKHFIYTEHDLDKLEFLIKLKNKGMSLKQITDYCDKLPLDKKDTFTKESSTASIDDFIRLLIESQSKEINKLQNNLLKEMESYIDIRFNLLTEKIIEEQNKQINNFEKTISEQIKNLFETKDELMNSYKDNSEYFTEYTNMIDKKSEFIKTDIIETLESLAHELKNNRISSNEILLTEIRKIKDIIYKSYCVEQELEKDTRNLSILKKLFALK
ncbi:MAG: helix-turn-helix domain-containing protein [Clostridium sp.]